MNCLIHFMKRKTTILATSIGLSFLFAFTVVKPQKTNNTKNIVWEKTTHDFGKVKMGSKLETTFKFTNKKKSPVTVTSATPGCTCTVPNYTKTPVAPGKTGAVSASYDTKDKPGVFNKTVNVVFNDGSKETLTIVGTVVTDMGTSNKPEFK